MLAPAACSAAPVPAVPRMSPVMVLSKASLSRYMMRSPSIVTMPKIPISKSGSLSRLASTT